MKAVLISDMSPVRTRLAELLSELPYIQLDVEESSAEADSIISRIDPAVVLVEIDQARGRGLEIIRSLRARNRAPVIMAIAATRSLRYRSSCLEAGAMFFFNAVREQDWLIESLDSIREQLGE
jgi:DNA-binding response OmpR family regulator